jgi:hypothetical protein
MVSCILDSITSQSPVQSPLFIRPIGLLRNKNNDTEEDCEAVVVAWMDKEPSLSFFKAPDVSFSRRVNHEAEVVLESTHNIE